MKKVVFFIIAIFLVLIGIFGYFIFRNIVYCPNFYNEIEKNLEDANHCIRDSDCDTISLGGSYIAFGCYHYINKDVDKDLFYKKIDMYAKRCTRMIDRCGTAPNATCVSGKCVSPV